MNRRAFFGMAAKAVAAFAILPAATTYARTWHRTRNVWVPVQYEQFFIDSPPLISGAMPFAARDFSGKWQFIIEDISPIGLASSILTEPPWVKKCPSGN